MSHEPPDPFNDPVLDASIEQGIQAAHVRRGAPLPFHPLPDCYEYVCKFYKKPVHVGVVVRTGKGRRGRIARKDGTQQYVYVRFDGERRVLGPFHPLDLDYFPEEP